MGRPSLLSHYVAEPRFRGRRDRALSIASREKCALRAFSARLARSSGGKTPSGSTCLANLSCAALRAAAVRAARSSVFAHETWAAILARRVRCAGVILSDIRSVQRTHGTPTPGRRVAAPALSRGRVRRPRSRRSGSTSHGISNP